MNIILLKLSLLQNHKKWQLKYLKNSFKNGWGYPHDGRADKNSYPHDCRADKDSYRHDRRADKNPYRHDKIIRFFF